MDDVRPTLVEQAPVRVKVEVAVNLIFLASLLFSFGRVHNVVGLADNGDFIRSMTVFTSSPVGFATDWPSNAIEFEQRFHTNWLPYWKLDWPGQAEVISSATLLWWPGVLLSAILMPGLLYLPIMSLPALAILTALFWTLLKWIEHSGNRWLYFTIALPTLLLITDAHYLAPLNSFYQDGPAFIFLLLTTVSIGWFVEKRTWPALAACIISSLLIGTAKASLFFWPILCLAICIWQSDNRVKRIVAGLALGLTVGLTMNLMPASVAMQQNSAANSLYTGILAESSDPQQRLNEIGLAVPLNCIGKSIFSERANICYEPYRDHMTYGTIAQVLVKEPMIVMRLIQFASSHMQEIDLRLGYFTQNDPRNKYSKLPTELSWWTAFKAQVFPTGGQFLFTLVIAVVINLWLSHQSGLLRTLSVIALLMAVGCFAELTVAILGDGKGDLVRHLYLANVTFDLLIIISLYPFLSAACNAWLYKIPPSFERIIVAGLVIYLTASVVYESTFGSIRRADFAEILVNSYSEVTGNTPPETSFTITDIQHLPPEERRAVKMLYGLGLTSGTYKQGVVSEFSPDDKLRPDQLITYISKWLSAVAAP